MLLPGGRHGQELLPLVLMLHNLLSSLLMNCL